MSFFKETIFPSIQYKDWHMHDCISHDAVGTPSEYAKRALECGLKSICITNHVEQFDYDNGRYEILPDRDIPRLHKDYEMILEAREEFPELEILFGVEFENNPPFYDAMEEIAGALDFDVIIGSVHHTDGIVVSSRDSLEEQRQAGPERLYNAYYREMLEFVKWGKFDYLGHGDLIRRYLVQLFPDFQPIIPIDRLTDIFTIMKQKDIGLEINTGGYFQAPKDHYPCTEIINIALDCGIKKFSQGSDSHNPQHLGGGYDQFSSEVLSARFLK